MIKFLKAQKDKEHENNEDLSMNSFGNDFSFADFNAFTAETVENTGKAAWEIEDSFDFPGSPDF